MAHRPTRKHQDLLRKIEEKKAKAKKNGKKLKRLEKWAKAYEALVQSGSSDA